MTGGVVDVFEVVQIQKDEGHRGSRAGALRNYLPEPVAQQGAIREAGQEIEKGHVFEGAALFLKLGLEL